MTGCGMAQMGVIHAVAIWTTMQCPLEIHNISTLAIMRSMILVKYHGYIVTTIMSTILRQIVHANMPVCYSQTGMLDLLIVTIINWIMRTAMGQVVSATEATHISLM